MCRASSPGEAPKGAWGSARDDKCTLFFVFFAEYDFQTEAADLSLTSQACISGNPTEVIQTICFLAPQIYCRGFLRTREKEQDAGGNCALG